MPLLVTGDGNDCVAPHYRQSIVQSSVRNTNCELTKYVEYVAVTVNMFTDLKAVVTEHGAHEH